MDKDFTRFLKELKDTRKAVAKGFIDLCDYWALEKKLIKKYETNRNK